MSIYDEKPWLKFYDEFVDPAIKIPDTTYTQMLETSLSDYADRAALHYMGTTLTFGEMDELSARFANFLETIGCEAGSVVGINLPNIPQFMIAFAGAQRAGCVTTGVSPLQAPKELAYQINDSGAKVLVTLDAIFAERFVKIADKVPNLTHIVAASVADYLPTMKRILAKVLKKVPTGKVEQVGGKTVLKFNEVMNRYTAKTPKAKVNSSDTCLIQYTGGTTGMPKGTEITHFNIIANFTMSNQWLDTQRGEEVYLSAFPYFHLAGLAFGMNGLASGNTQICIPDPRNIKHLCEEFIRYNPTSMANVPSLYMMLTDEPMFRTLEFSQLRAAMSGAAPFAVESIRALEEIIGEGKVVEVYGMTETSPLMTMNPLEGTKKIGTVGLPIQNTRIKLVDIETGAKEVPLGEEGELICIGPQVMKGYLNKPEETDHAIRDFQGEKWLYTGDVARMDEDGYFTICDRTKDMLIVSGFKVFSIEVEDTLYQHPAIEFCAIVGLPNPDRPGSEIVKAVIQLSDSHKDKNRDDVQKDIAAYCKENMSPYKVPKQIEFVDEIPLTAVGKVDKKLLR